MNGYPPGFAGAPSINGLVPPGMSASPKLRGYVQEPQYCQNPNPAKIPPTEFDECLEALGAKLEDTMQVSTLEPRIVPPYRSRYITHLVRGVIAVPAAYDAAAFAGSLSLALAASTISGVLAAPVLFLVPTELAPPFAPQEFFQHTTAPGHVTVFRTWGITVQNSVPIAAKVFAEAQGPNYGSESLSALSSGALAEEHEPTMLVIPENKSLTVRIQNLDVSSGILVNFGITGWQFPITMFDDSLKSLVTRKGFGQRCGT